MSGFTRLVGFYVLSVNIPCVATLWGHNKNTVYCLVDRAVCVCVCVLLNHVIYTVVMRYSTLISLNSRFSTNDFPLYFWWLWLDRMASLHLKGSRLIQFLFYRVPFSTRICYQFPLIIIVFSYSTPTSLQQLTSTIVLPIDSPVIGAWLGLGAMLLLYGHSNRWRCADMFSLGYLYVPSKLKSTTA